jgi:hypothetical protein
MTKSGFDVAAWLKLLDRLRRANDGYCLTIWGDSAHGDAGWKLWRRLDAKYAESGSGWIMTIPLETIADELEIIQRSPSPSVPVSG